MTAEAGRTSGVGLLDLVATADGVKSGGTGAGTESVAVAGVDAAGKIARDLARGGSAGAAGATGASRLATELPAVAATATGTGAGEAASRARSCRDDAQEASSNEQQASRK